MSDSKGVSGATRNRVELFEKVCKNNLPIDERKQREKARFNSKLAKFEKFADKTNDANNVKVVKEERKHSFHRLRAGFEHEEIVENEERSVSKEFVRKASLAFEPSVSIEENDLTEDKGLIGEDRDRIELSNEHKVEEERVRREAFQTRAKSFEVNVKH